MIQVNDNNLDTIMIQIICIFLNYKPTEGFRKPSPILNMIVQITSFQFNVIWRNIKYEL